MTATDDTDRSGDYNRAMTAASTDDTLGPDSRIDAASDRAIAEAARHLKEGRLAAFPTETVYGVAADATDGEAVARLFAAKGRPEGKPFVIQFASAAEAEARIPFSAAARRLARRFWPGPLTLVVPAGQLDWLAPGVAGEDGTIGLRIPDHPVALKLLRRAGRPLAVSSANLSGGESPRSARDIPPALRQALAIVLDGGDCQIGVPSTVVAVIAEELKILRQGSVSAAELEAAAREQD